MMDSMTDASCNISPNLVGWDITFRTNMHNVSCLVRIFESPRAIWVLLQFQANESSDK